jgi:hypothetical protein
MTIRTFIDKNGNSWSWDETPEVVEAVKVLHKQNESKVELKSTEV